jgi:ubiquinone/menaquinone biosynthesis C-methylase UbiE
MNASSHKQVVQDSFNRQAEAYAASPAITDRDRLLRLVEAVGAPADARVLDVATGPGFLAMAFAESCREVVGVDLTPGPLAIAERTRHDRALPNVRFQLSDADSLPFAGGEFDVTVCRLAFHHFESPLTVLEQMARVSSGTVAVEDLVASEHPERAAYQNRFERLRDLSHTRALPASELMSLFRDCGLEIVRLYSSEIVANLERWLVNSQTPPEPAAQVRRMIAGDAARDLSGCRPFLQDGEWYFRQMTLALVGRKIAR